MPLYRQYNPYAETGTHNYTADENENDALVELGWEAEGIAWYGIDVDDDATVDDDTADDQEPGDDQTGDDTTVDDDTAGDQDQSSEDVDADKDAQEGEPAPTA